MTDLVVPVRPGKHDEPESLRYSLRTIWHHMDVGKIWIVGHLPSWLDSGLVGHIPSDQRTQMFANRKEPYLKFQNQETNLRAVMASDVAEDFVWWSDDFFVLQDFHDTLPYYHRGPLRSYLDTLPHFGMGEYGEGLGFCLKLLEAWGYPHPDAYNVHMPLPVNKTKLIEVMEMAWAEGLEGGFMRPIYPVVCGDDRSHVEVVDPKLRGDQMPETDHIFISTDRGSWGNSVGKYIRNRYWRAAPYEVNR